MCYYYNVYTQPLEERLVTSGRLMKRPHTYNKLPAVMMPLCQDKGVDDLGRC